MSDDPKLDEANAKVRACAEFLDYLLGNGYVIVDMDSIRARAPRYGDDPDRFQGVVEMSCPINPMRIVYDAFGLECPTSHTEDGINSMRENYRRLSGGAK